MNTDQILTELDYKATRSGGPGGQHANKVASKVEVSFDIENSLGLTEDEKKLLLKNLDSKLTNNNFIILKCEETRSQHTNKEIVTQRLFSALEEGLVIPKKRKRTKPPKSGDHARLEQKKQHSQKKELRKKPKL
ncbi:MAG TPA: alternative ribosome rescue aminoacyl-tRNA hydrolase ArfB [Flavobacteriaceae bacterium]|nr:alternative ribosome rescue aminoacyl-tRNA hydrolase ArfB [Flavobacteriaceae bacterium]